MIDAQKRAKLTEFGRELLYKTSLTEGIPLISTYAKDIIGADRCSIFIYNPEKNEFWTTLADGVDRIIMPADKGIVGETLRTKKASFENDVHSNPYFMGELDKKTGYITKSVITAPIFNYKKEVGGVLELLNKEGGFKEDDIKYMKFFAQYVGEFLELIKQFKNG